MEWWLGVADSRDQVVLIGFTREEDQQDLAQKVERLGGIRIVWDSGTSSEPEALNQLGKNLPQALLLKVLHHHPKDMIADTLFEAVAAGVRGVGELQGEEYEAIQDSWNCEEFLKSLASEGLVPKNAYKKGYDYIIYKSNGDLYSLVEVWGVHGVPHLTEWAERIK